MSRPRRPLAVFLLAGAALTTGARAEVEVTLDPPAITVGDPATATLAVDLPGNATLTFPDWSRGWGDARVLEAGPVEATPAGGRTRYRQRITLTAFRIGKIELPPVAIRTEGGAGELTTPKALALEVRSVLPADAAQSTPMPPEPPRPLPRPRAALWTIGALALAIAAAAFAARRAGLVRAAAGEAPALPPLPELEAALAALAGVAPASGHARLSTALRRYFGRALGFHAVESTTREIERQLAARHLEATLVARSARLLRDADQVKFARRDATSDELERRRTEALALAGAVETHLRPPAAEEGAA